LFLYSRKPQLLLLFCWSIALAGLFAYATGNTPFFFAQKSEAPGQTRARLGEMPPPPPPAVVQPVVPPPEPVPLPAPTPPPAPQQPAPDPTMNRGMDFRAFPAADGDEKKLVLEFDYIPAERNGFTPEKAHTFFTDDTPTFVIVLGSPWKLEVSRKIEALNMKQATRVYLWMSLSGQLRLVTHTRTVAEAAGARARMERTPTGLRAEIHFTR
jgi:hypothetical protein